MNSPKKIICGILILILWVICSFIVPSMALEVETHRTINEYLADKNIALNGFSLHQYLQRQLGLQNGSEEYLNSKKVFKWLGDGGVYEDEPPGCVPYWRSRNHFHNPMNKSGFSGWWDTGIFSGMSAVNWILQPANTQSCGCYSWNDARDYYYKALTSPDKATRETNLADAFRAIGQSMHLVQDMSVPEHTRNNGHYFFYDYEEWANGITISTYSATPFTSSGVFSFPIGNLFDTNQYNGVNPEVTTQSAIGLAEYTNANFLSPKTIFTANFAYPDYFDTKPIEPKEYDPISGKQILYLTKSGHGETIKYFARARSFYNYLPIDYKKLDLTLDDPKVYESYASKLIPRAIGYSADLLGYFFRGKIEIGLPMKPDGPVYALTDDQNLKDT
ncbi:MAG: hypothetical protein ABFD82_05710, partial [Syntrophaceae bacterium]